MDDERGSGLNVFHISIGSAATNVHLSTDISCDNPQKYEIIDQMFDTWERCRIKRSMIDVKFKK